MVFLDEFSDHLENFMGYDTEVMKGEDAYIGQHERIRKFPEVS